MQENSIIKNNILQFLDCKGITPYKYYKETGTTRGVLTQNNGMSEENTLRFLAHYPEVNTEWLLTGNGEMLKKDMLPLAVKSNDGIPLIPVNAMAGVAAGEISVLDLECDRYVIPMFKGADYLISVKGSSMYPKYSSGDVVACKMVPLKNIFFQWNKVYVLDTDQGVLIKRIHKSDKKDHIKIVSENPKYEPFDLHVEHIYAISIVIGVVRVE